MATMKMFTVYHRPSDFPDVEFLVRELDVSAGQTLMGAIMGTAETLDDARALVPATHDMLIPRVEDDDPVIVETWI